MNEVNLGTATAGIGLDLRGLTSGMQEARRGFAEISRAMKSLEADSKKSTTTISDAHRRMAENIKASSEKAVLALRSVISTGRLLGGVVSAGLLAVGKSSIDAAIRMDSLRRALVTVSGSAEAAEKQFEKLREVAKLPGLGLEDALKGSIRLQATGFSAKEAENALKAFGNALASVGKGATELDGVTLALSQIQAKGKVSAEEINQLAERLPQIRKIMQQAFGTADTEVLQKAKINSKQFIDVIVAEFNRLPKVTGGIKNDFENARDSITQSLDRIGTAVTPLVATILGKLVPALEAGSKAFAPFLSDLSGIINTAVQGGPGAAAAFRAMGVEIAGMGGIAGDAMRSIQALLDTIGIKVRQARNEITLTGRAVTAKDDAELLRAASLRVQKQSGNILPTPAFISNEERDAAKRYGQIAQTGNMATNAFFALDNAYRSALALQKNLESQIRAGAKATPATAPPAAPGRTGPVIDAKKLAESNKKPKKGRTTFSAPGLDAELTPFAFLPFGGGGEDLIKRGREAYLEMLDFMDKVRQRGEAIRKSLGGFEIGKALTEVSKGITAVNAAEREKQKNIDANRLADSIESGRINLKEAVFILDMKMAAEKKYSDAWMQLAQQRRAFQAMIDREEAARRDKQGQDIAAAAEAILEAQQFAENQQNQQFAQRRQARSAEEQAEISRKTDAIRQSAGILEDSFSSLFNTGRVDNFLSSMVNGFKQAFAQIAADMLAAKVISQLFGVGAAGAAGLGGPLALFGSIFGGGKSRAQSIYRPAGLSGMDGAGSSRAAGGMIINITVNGASLANSQDLPRLADELAFHVQSRMRVTRTGRG